MYASAYAIKSIRNVPCNKKYSKCALHVSSYYVVLCNKMVYVSIQKKLLLNSDSITTKNLKKMEEEETQSGLKFST